MSELRKVVITVAHKFGVITEKSFREAIGGLLSKYFGASAEKWCVYDGEGIVYGKPSIVDIDVVVVSDGWRGLPMNRRLSILYRLWGYDYDVTFYSLTRDELIKWIDRSIVLRDASKYWIKIYSRSHGLVAIDNKDSFKT